MTKQSSTIGFLISEHTNPASESELDGFTTKPLNISKHLANSISHAAVVVDVSGDHNALAEELKKLRKCYASPIIAMTDSNKEILLDAGADYCLPKKVAPNVLTAFISAASRRYNNDFSDFHISVGAIRADSQSRKLYANNQEVSLTDQEFNLARCLLINVGNVLSRNYLEMEVWPHRKSEMKRTLDTHINNIKRKIDFESHGMLVKSIYRKGYQLLREND